MPRQLRCYDYTEDQYRVWSLVRRIQAIPSDVGEDKTRYEIGVAFIGKRLPVSAEQDPTKLYDVTHQTETGLWALREQRDRATEERLHTLVERETRHSIPVGVTVAVIGEKGKITASETTVTENISQHGAAVFTTLDVERGSFVRLISAQYQISVLAEVRGQSKGAGGINRLHLSFVDRVWPLEGIE